MQSIKLNEKIVKHLGRTLTQDDILVEPLRQRHRVPLHQERILRYACRETTT